MSQRCIEIDSPSVAQTMALGAAIGRLVRAGDVIGLSGELGAGKTQFVRGLAQGMGMDARQVASPTFVLMREYARVEKSGLVLVHIDAYRLGQAEAMATIGWEGEGEELRAGAVVAVEWAEMVEQVLGADVLRVRMRHGGAGRIIEIMGRGMWEGRMGQVNELVAGIDVRSELMR